MLFLIYKMPQTPIFLTKQLKLQYTAKIDILTKCVFFINMRVVCTTDQNADIYRY